MEMSLRLNNGWSLVAIASILLSVSVGCSSGEPMGTISGTVTSNGEACGNCELGFLDPTTKRWTGATVNDQGEFVLKEINFGEYQVEVRQVLDPHAAGDPPPDDRIPEKYRDASTSGITFVIDSTDDVVLEIKMTGKFVGKNRAKQDPDDAMD